MEKAYCYEVKLLKYDLSILIADVPTKVFARLSIKLIEDRKDHADLLRMGDLL